MLSLTQCKVICNSGQAVQRTTHEVLKFSILFLNRITIEQNTASVVTQILNKITKQKIDFYCAFQANN